MSYTPEDMIPDDKSHFEMDGKTIRKGTMAAALANAEIIESTNSTAEEKRDALNAIKELVPVLKAFGLARFLTWKNPEIQALFDESNKA